LGTCSLNVYALGVDISANYCYVTAGVGYEIMGPSMRVMDISTPSVPTEIGCVSSIGLPEDACILDDIAYVIFYNGILKVFDVSQPQEVVEIGSIDTSWQFKDLEIESNLAYIVTSFGYGISGFTIFDISNPDQPLFLSQWYSSSTAFSCIDVKDNFVFLGGENHVNIINVSDPDNPFQCSSLNTNSMIEAIIVIDNYFIYADGYHYIHIVNYSDPYNPLEVGQLEVDLVNEMEIVEDNLFTAGWEGLFYIDISNSSNPIIISHLEFPYQLTSIKIQNQYAYVGDFNGGLRIFDISDPYNIYDVGEYYITFTINDFRPFGNYALSLNNYYIYVFDCSQALFSKFPTIDIQQYYFALFPLYPNPFNSSISVNFSLKQAGDILLTVHEIHGREVKVLEKGFFTPGIYQAVWNNNNFSSGVYFIRLQQSERLAIEKAVLLK
jgi:hypothetical protein